MGCAHVTEVGKPIEQPIISEVSDQVEPSLFFIRAGGGTGSGFLFRDPGLVATNRHVVEGVGLGEEVILRPVIRREDGFTDLGGELQGTLVLKHPDLDLALVTLNQSWDATPLVPLKSSMKYLGRGMAVLAHGFPSTLSPIVSDGILSGHYRDPRSGTIFYITDAALASGSSGGPVTDYDGALVGMTTGLYRFSEGEEGFNWGFVLPASVLEGVVEKYLEGEEEVVAVEDLVAKVRNRESTEGQIRELRTGFVELVNRSGTHLELLENLTEYMVATRPIIRIQSASDFQEGLRTVFHLAEVSMQRSFDLARRDVPGSNQKVLGALQDFMKLLSGWHLQVTDELPLDTPRQLENMLSTVLNIYSASFREYAGRAKKACVAFSGYESSDPLTKRTYEYWSAFTETEMMRRLIVLSGGMSERVVAAASRVHQEPEFYRLRGALMELKKSQAAVGKVFANECAFVLEAHTARNPPNAPRANPEAIP